jgi:methionyl-tRNA synthetase
VLVLLKKDGGTLSAPAGTLGADKVAAGTWKTYEDHMNELNYNAALDQGAMGVVMKANEMMQTVQPWTIKDDPARRTQTLSEFAEILRHVSLMLLPFMPETAHKMAVQLNVPYAAKMLDKSFAVTKQMKTWGGALDWKQVGEPSILFAPVEAKK